MQTTCKSKDIEIRAKLSLQKGSGVMTEEEGRSILNKHGLRITAPRLAVLNVLASAKSPISHAKVFDKLKESRWDPATIYRNLVKLCDSNVAVVVSRANGVARYSLAAEHGQHHHHPHFICDKCGQVACLVSEIAISLKSAGRWANALQNSTVQFRGNCPECTEVSASSLS